MARKYSSETQVVSPKKSGTLRLLLIGAAVLIVAALMMRVLRPNQAAEVYNPPPPPPKTATEIEQQIKLVQDNKRIPPGEKGRILGFLQSDLEKAKATQTGAGTK